MKRSYKNPKEDLSFLALTDDLSRLPFSFIYNGQRYSGFSAEHFAEKARFVERTEGKETRTLVSASLPSLRRLSFDICVGAKLYFEMMLTA